MFCRFAVALSSCEGAVWVKDEDVLHLGAKGIDRVIASRLRVYTNILFVRAVQEELNNFFPTLLDFAGTLASAAPENSRKAGAALYVTLFLHFESCFHRQVEHTSCQSLNNPPSTPALQGWKGTESCSMLQMVPACHDWHCRQPTWGHSISPGQMPKSRCIDSL